MNNTFKRSDRVAEMLQRKLSLIIQQEINDPRLPAFITISAVKVTSDLAYAKIYFTVFNKKEEETAAILNSAASYLRSALARTVKLRTVPQLQFIYDKSIEYGQQLSKLIDKVNPSTGNDEL